jgi:SAM-dependent methyltransferase
MLDICGLAAVARADASTRFILFPDSAMSSWFESWFNTPWYHSLYRHRDEQEAFAFIDRLLDWLKPEPESTILDLACGRGRHAIRLAEHRLDVTGIDLSKANIQAARAHERDNLHFYEHDMRKPFRFNYFDTTLNLFTSFGYFDREEDNLKSLDAVAKGLRPKGRFVIDFLHAEKTTRDLVPEETVEQDGLSFHITRRLEGEHIVKRIAFQAEGTQHHYQERVQAIRKGTFEQYFNKVGLATEAVFGNYALEPFGADSPRLILVARKAAD